MNEQLLSRVERIECAIARHWPDVTPIHRGRQSRRVHADDVEWLINAGETRQSIAVRLGVTVNAVYDALHRNGRLDLVERLAHRDGAA